MSDYTITRFTPERIGYKDRGILKWQGMMLSDHTEALKKMKNEVSVIAGKDEMNAIEISQVLHRAYATNSPVSIQANIIRNGSYYKDVVCKVAGYGRGKIHLMLKDGRTTSCTLEEIRNVEFMDVLDWHDKRK